MRFFARWFRTPVDSLVFGPVVSEPGPYGDGDWRDDVLASSK